MDPAVLKAIGDYGLAVVGIVALSGVVWWFIRDLRQQRDRALDVSDRQVASTEKLTHSVDELIVVVHELSALVRDRGRRS